MIDPSLSAEKKEQNAQIVIFLHSGRFLDYINRRAICQEKNVIYITFCIHSQQKRLQFVKNRDKNKNRAAQKIFRLQLFIPYSDPYAPIFIRY